MKSKRNKTRYVVKRKGHEEAFDERKVYASCYAACLNASLHSSKAEKICERLTKEIKFWFKSKKTVTSNQIFKKVTVVLKKHDENASFMYETHRDVS